MRLNKGEVDLETGISEFKRGIELARILKNRLGEIENEIKEIKDEFKDMEEPAAAEVESVPEPEPEPEEEDPEQIPF